MIVYRFKMCIRDRVHTVEATPANVHDVTQPSSLLTGEEDVVYGDSGYLGVSCTATL